ncbi:MAG: iron-containing alcohol dehydrogenase [Suipraeoptans sp.]
MGFAVKPTIEIYKSLVGFVEAKELGKTDLIVTNEFVLKPQMGDKELPCDVLYQEKYGNGEPNDEMVSAMLSDVQGKGYTRIIAIGGGTVIDISKLLVFGDGYTLDELYAQGATLPKKRELIAVPTTCGTGSEVTNISIVYFKKKRTKFGLVVPQLFPDESALIPDMLKSLPYEVFAASSIDALIHAAESQVSPGRATPFSRMFGKEAINKILKGYMKIRETGKHELPEEMEDYMVASTMAGIAFVNAGCASVHALAFPIGGIYHVPHGMATYMVFEETFKMDKELGGNLSELEKVLAEVFECDESESIDKMFDLLGYILDRKKLAEFDVTEDICAEMAATVVDSQQRLLINNPVNLTVDQIKTIYMRCI